MVKYLASAVENAFERYTIPVIRSARLSLANCHGRASGGVRPHAFPRKRAIPDGLLDKDVHSTLPLEEANLPGLPAPGNDGRQPKSCL